MEVTPEGVELIEKIQKKTTEVPGAYNQGTWAEKVDPSQAPCGTAACIAGWACLLSGQYVDAGEKNMMGIPVLKHQETAKRIDIEDAATALLGLDGDEADALFAPLPSAHWPYEFADRWAEARTDLERAQVASDYLEHIKTTGDVFKDGCYGSDDDAGDGWGY